MSGPNEIELGHVQVTVSGRFLLRRSAAPAPLLVGFHGYGEGASVMLEALHGIPAAPDWHVVSIQGLHPFYNRRTGEVVASWMTKQDRELAIAENVAYVEKALEHLAGQVEIDGPTVFAGFSQGTAMAYRAAAALGSACQGIVALAGDVPPELSSATNWGRPPVLIGRGTEDAWYNEAKAEHDEAILGQLGSEVEVCVFEGGHEWTGAFHRAAADFLERLRG